VVSYFSAGVFPSSFFRHPRFGERAADSTDSILCSEFAIKRIDEPFITAQDNASDWLV
jgi:hypothetical protein